MGIIEYVPFRRFKMNPQGKYHALAINFKKEG
jgi:hypothetical protein